ncbi:MAG TPA: lipoprotein insertase outer membrane protein LolB [Burkholderiales bacterium]|nr:lipoprotein insertase outer membrane protein LolB [Burkholderiales bacterium]
MSRLARVAAALAALVIGACASLEPRAPEGPLEFDLAGRLAARYNGESFTGNLSWQHGRGGDEVLISSPLGQGVARIVREQGEVVLTTAKREEYRAADAESLTEKVLGFRLPLSGLADWVRARPSAGHAFHVERSPEGRVRSLQQRGWRIEYLRYDGERPALLQLSYPGIELRLAITQWK